MIAVQTFQKLLLSYRDEHNLSYTDLAKVAKVSRPTLYHWLRGGTPTVASVRRACENLGVDAQTILSPGLSYVGCGFSFKTLQERFTERITVEPEAAFEIVILAGAMLHTRLLRSGCPFTSTTLPTGQVVMHAAQDAQVGKLLVSLQWNAAAIMLIVAAPGQPSLLSEPLSEDTFNRAVEILNQ